MSFYVFTFKLHDTGRGYTEISIRNVKIPSFVMVSKIFICVTVSVIGTFPRHHIYMRNKMKHNAGNIIKKPTLAFKSRSRRDRESNHGPPACQAEVLTTTPSRLFRRRTPVVTFINLT